MLEHKETLLQNFSEFAPHLNLLQTWLNSLVQVLEYVDHSEVSLECLHQVLDQYFVSLEIQVQFPNLYFVANQFGLQISFVGFPVLNVEFIQSFILGLLYHLIALIRLLKHWKTHVMQSDGLYRYIIGLYIWQWSFKLIIEGLCQCSKLASQILQSLLTILHPFKQLFFIEQLLNVVFHEGKVLFINMKIDCFNVVLLKLIDA